MRNHIPVLLTFSLLSLAVDAATTITATVTSAAPFNDNTTDSSIGTSTAVRNYGAANSNDPIHMLEDGFTYNPLAPLTASPSTGFNDNTHYHGAGATNSVISFDVPFTIPADPTQATFVVDIWPRTANSGGWRSRDDTFTIGVLDTAGTLLSSVTTGIADNSSAAAGLSRNLFSLPVGTAIGQVTITTPVSSVAYAEVRFAAIPEPSGVLLVAMAACGFGLRRRR